MLTYKPRRKHPSHGGVMHGLFPRFQVVRAMHSGAFPRGDGSQYEVYSFGGGGKWKCRSGVAAAHGKLL